MSDEKLYDLCRKYGSMALEARRKFIGLLPEVFRRKLYRKKGFASIHEFAAKLAGLSHDHVNRVLQLDRKYEDKPVLRYALTQSNISMNKLVRIASIATKDNQLDLLEMAQKLSKAAIEVFVKDYKAGAEASGNAGACGGSGGGKSDENMKRKHVDQGDATCDSRLFETSEPVPGHRLTQNHDYEILAALSPELKQKMKDLIDKHIDINEIFLAAIADREKEINGQKELAAREDAEKRAPKRTGNSAVKPDTRYIPVKVRKIVHKEYGDKCGRKNCTKPAAQIHHERKFSVWQSHDPHYLKPLCKAHHEIAHAGDAEFLRYRRAAIS